jgi:hypothetical protein
MANQTQVELFQQYINASAAAEIAGDYATALTQAQAAQAVLCTLPHVQHRSPAGTESADWSAHVKGLDQRIVRLRQAMAGALGVQVANKRYDRAQESGPGSVTGQYV